MHLVTAEVINGKQLEFLKVKKKHEFMASEEKIETIMFRPHFITAFNV
jgi:hypothetical protein